MALSDESTGPLTKRLKGLVQRTVHALGLHVGRYPPVDSLAYHLRTAFRQLAIDFVIDIGAHTGEYGEFLRVLGYEGPIFSLEPIAASFDALVRRKSGDPLWHAERAAVGLDEGEREMNVYEGSVFNSFLTTNAYAGERFGAATKLARTEKVPVRRLETLIDETQRAHGYTSLFVKMDTQGYDMHVLESAGARSSAIRALQTEQATRPTYENMLSFPDALRRLGEAGFELTGIFPVARDKDHLRVIEFDCVMFRAHGR
jgi:FkbM family methyltransferase